MYMSRNIHEMLHTHCEKTHKHTLNTSISPHLLTLQLYECPAHACRVPTQNSHRLSLLNIFSNETDVFSIFFLCATKNNNKIKQIK